ncbi:hypothetical protein [Natrarchaeobius chitinivorans]|uniref:Uncharacterized protein n=1 Tax=Natrarchaeobius chitinivorans TaxID=1679083 RepID=A0A3N6M873_NATCH|nr:hypothetical protein [Natrarchaeobius chitinivorans]RQG92400.1 hypothetical protein EA473_16635 [Natrarchaeobius chitinivorans]
MSFTDEIHDLTSVDDADFVCARCDDPLCEERMVYLSSRPCPELADSYAAVTKAYCPDCIAGIGMLAFTAEARAHAPGPLE